MKLVDYAPETTIYSKNEKITKFLIINNGKCKIVNESKEILRTLTKNDFFGLISLFTNSSKNYNLITIEKTQTLELNKEFSINVEELKKINSDWFKKFDN